MLQRIYKSILLLTVLTVFCFGEWIVGDVIINGNNSISDRTIIKRMQQKPQSLINKSTPFSLIQLIEDLASIQSLYQSKGYYNTQAKIDSLEYDSLHSIVTVFIDIKEGSLITVDSITFSGKTFLSDEELIRLIPLNTGDPLDSQKIALSVISIRDTLNKSGFWYADVSYNSIVNTNDSIANVVFFTNQGPVVLAGDLRFNGFERVFPKVAERNLDFVKNQILTSDLIRRSTRKLYETGLFKTILIQPIDTLTVAPISDSVYLPLLIAVEEGSMLLLSGGGGYDSYEKLYISLLVGYKNLFGTGHRISTQGKLSSALKGAYLNYMFPWFFDRPLNGYVTAYIERQDQPSFKGLFNGGSVSLNGGWGWNNYFGSRIRLEHTQWIQEDPNVISPEDISHQSTIAIGGFLRKDTRNAILSPGTGLYASIFTEIAGPFLPHTNQFYKYEIDLRSYTTFKTRAFSISSAFFSGYVNGYASDKNEVPQQELFRPGFGAVRPVRGYKPEQVAPADAEGNAIGGKYTLIINFIEVRINIYRWIAGAIFIDAGRAFSELSDFSFSDLRWSAGPGLMADTPLGLLRVDYGIQLRRSPQARVLFSIGLPF